MAFLEEKNLPKFDKITNLKGQKKIRLIEGDTIVFVEFRFLFMAYELYTILDNKT